MQRKAKRSSRPAKGRGQALCRLFRCLTGAHAARRCVDGWSRCPSPPAGRWRRPSLPPAVFAAGCHASSLISLQDGGDQPQGQGHQLQGPPSADHAAGITCLSADFGSTRPRLSTHHAVHTLACADLQTRVKRLLLARRTSTALARCWPSPTCYCSATSCSFPRELGRSRRCVVPPTAMSLLVLFTRASSGGPGYTSCFTLHTRYRKGTH